MVKQELLNENRRFVCGDIATVMFFKNDPYLVIDIIDGRKTAIIAPIRYFGTKGEEIGNFLDIDLEELKSYAKEKAWPLERIVAAYGKTTKEDPAGLEKIRQMFQKRMQLEKNRRYRPLDVNSRSQMPVVENETAAS